MDGRIWAFGVLGCLGLGCSGHVPPAYSVYAPPEAPAAVSSDNGFALYVQAADDAEARAGKLKTRVSLTASDKKALFDATDPAIKLLDKGSAMNVSFVFARHKPFEAPPHQLGWRLIGRALNRHIDDACQAGKYDAAIGYLLLATKFGFDLVGGGATDASLGLSIVDSAREALLDSLPQLTPEQLQKLSAGLQKALHSKPELATMIGHEKLNMLVAVDTVQEAYRKDDYDVLLKRLGQDVRDAVKHLQQEVKPKDEKERPKYFDAFAKEAEAEAAWETELASLPGVQRAGKKGPDSLPGDRPWRRWAKQFFQAGRPLLGMVDETVARTRLLALWSLIESQVKSQKHAPSSLADFTPEMILDPFTGGTFVYRAQGLMFKVYSVGDNFRDDGGQSDGPMYERPDLTLELR